MSDEITLNIAGFTHKGWKTVQVQKSLDQLCGSFTVGVSDKFPGDPARWKIKMGSPVEVKANSDTVITGFVDDMNIDYDARNHSVTIAGRDNTGDLVDCSYIGTPNEWINQTPTVIIGQLCNPFGISVVVDPTVTDAASGPIEKFKANDSETVFSLIAKLCKQRGMWPISIGDGNLTLTRAGSWRSTDTLEVGKNIKGGRIKNSNKDRFSLYKVKGQGVGKSTKALIDFIQPIGEMTDEYVRYRPIVIIADAATDSEGATRRAEWEARTRAGKSRELSYTVVGWTQSDGQLWTLNSLVGVKDSYLGIEQMMLIYNIVYQLDDQGGTTTTMKVCDPNAYELMGQPVRIRTKWDKDQWDI